jgi:hypothetical protein
MEKYFDILRHSRTNFLSLVQELSLDALNKISDGFNNNIVWNLGHIIVSQQLLCYKLSHLEPKIDTAYILRYRKGSKPESYVGQEEVERLKQDAVLTIEELVADYKQGLFREYTPYETSYGVALATVEDAITFVSVHDGLHLGYAMALKRLVNK